MTYIKIFLFKNFELDLWSEHYGPIICMKQRHGLSKVKHGRCLTNFHYRYVRTVLSHPIPVVEIDANISEFS